MNNSTIPIGKHVIDRETQNMLFMALFPEKYPNTGKKYPDSKKGYPTSVKVG